MNKPLHFLLFCFFAACLANKAAAQVDSIITVAGGPGSIGAYAGDGLLATSSGVSFFRTINVKLDGHGNLYIADFTVPRIRKVDAATGIIHTIAGTGVAGYSGDGGPATSAQIGDMIRGIGLGSHGDLYISDNSCDCIRKVDANTGIISTIGSVSGGTTDDIYVDSSENLFYADVNGVRKIPSGSSASILIAGGGSVLGDGGPATAASFHNTMDVTGDALGNLYITDQMNYRVRKVTPAGIITTFAGTGVNGYTGDGGPATDAQLTYPLAICTDINGNVYVSEGLPGRHIRKIDAATGIITTIAGDDVVMTGSADDSYFTPYRADSIDAYAIKMCMDVNSNLYIAPYGGFINKISSHLSASMISSDSFFVSLEEQCNGPHILVHTNSFVAGSQIVTSYGDGTTDTTSVLNISGAGYCNISHIYSTEGCYTIQQILLHSSTPIDTLSFTDNYTFCRTLPLKIYYDANSDCTKQPTEPYIFSPSLAEVDSNGIAIDTLSATSGLYYNAYGHPGDIYRFRIISTPSTFNFTYPSTGTISDTLIATNTPFPDKYIGMNCGTSTEFDLQVFSQTYCGTHLSNADIFVSNTACTPTDGTVTYVIDPKYTFNFASSTPTSIVGNTISWTVPSLSAFSPLPAQIHVTMSNSGPLLTSGDTVVSNFSVSPTAGDANPSNNIFIEIDTVLSSYDPNNISVLPTGCVPADNTPKELTYTIHFENTGNDTARNVVIYDTLNANLNLSTYRVVFTKAAMMTTQLTHLGMNILRFEFPNINLLDSSHHIGCDGMVTFKISTLPSLTEGTIINNSAGIYFDYNPVIMTNTSTEHIGCEYLGVPKQAKTDDINLFPNPAKNEVTIDLNVASWNSLSIYNTMGQELLKEKIDGRKTTLNLLKFDAGVYYLNFSGPGGKLVKKMVVVP